MDSVNEIKSRLHIEDLVARYCQLQKKGRSFVCLCPFHNDTKPSFLISPDKGIGYCFACQSGGDIFSFYQKIEGVDFPEALKALAEMAGVTLPDRPVTHGPKKEEKERLRDCLSEAQSFFVEQYKKSNIAQDYVASRKVPAEQVQAFGLGYAPDSFSATYEYLLKKDFSRTEIIASGLGIQKDLGDSRMYDRYRNRLTFPIRDVQGNIIGFGGRTLGQDDAKYINSSESPLYHKSSVLFGVDVAREEIRKRKQVILVEGYFDVLACHRVGAIHAVATCGTALTEEHVNLLKRQCESVVLCLDADRAGQEASERAFMLLSKEGITVTTVVLPQKDAADLVNDDPEQLKELLFAGGIPYAQFVIDALAKKDLSSAHEKRTALTRVLTLLQAVPLAVEREALMERAAAAFQTSSTALRDDFIHLQQAPVAPINAKSIAEPTTPAFPFDADEIVLGMILTHPTLLPLLSRLIEPEKPFAKKLYQALRVLPQDQMFSINDLTIEDEVRERAMILLLWNEEHGFADWSESLAAREVKKNCVIANREFIKKKQQEITSRLTSARKNGDREEEAILTNQYQEVLKLSKMASA